MSGRVPQFMLLSYNPIFCFYLFFFFNDTATTEIYTLSLHDALPISTRVPFQPDRRKGCRRGTPKKLPCATDRMRSEEHTSELQSRLHLVCRLLLEKKKKNGILRILHRCRRLSAGVFIESMLTASHDS